MFRDDTVAYIKDLAAEVYGLRTSEAFEVSRSIKVIAAKHLAVRLLRKYTDMTLKDIAAVLGFKDHSSVHHYLDRDMGQEEKMYWMQAQAVIDSYLDRVRNSPPGPQPDGDEGSGLT